MSGKFNPAALSILLLFLFTSSWSYTQSADTIPARHQVTLKEAHTGSLHIDTLLLDSYETVPGNVRKFYLEARKVFTENKDADFTNHRLWQQQNDTTSV